MISGNVFSRVAYLYESDGFGYASIKGCSAIH
jgi:hypothetical protein